MIRIFLTPPEFAHYLDLTTAMPSVFKLPNHDSAEGQREVRIKALESVVGMDRPRARIGGEKFEVYGSRRDPTARWA